MRLNQTLKVVWANIAGNRMRSFLTMLGMIIGVASVIILVSLMQGEFDSMMDSYGSMGINDVQVNLIGRNGNMLIKDSEMYEYAKKYPESIRGIVPSINADGNNTVSKNGVKLEYTNIQGIDDKYLAMYDKKLQDGHCISYSDILVRNKVCIIGSYINMTFFKGKASVGDRIRIKGEEFAVVGILKAIDNSSQWSQDNCVYIPYSTAMRLEGVSAITAYTVCVKSGEQVGVVTAQLQKYLFGIFHDSKAFKVTNNMQSIKEINAQMSILTSVIGGIAGISLVVAGIGIMNIMLVSVSERTKEIGIRKSLGAKYKDIRRQFVMEAAVTSTMGGLLGILLGFVGTIKIGDLVKLKALPNTGTVIMAFTISVSIGIIFGYLPARKAAKLNPIDALRNE
jgi:ABC-type antimicrobial peptide transport system, permease component